MELLNKIYHGDNADVLAEVKALAKYGYRVAIVSDPPYGGDYDTDYDRFSNGGGDA